MLLCNDTVQGRAMLACALRQNAMAADAGLNVKAIPAGAASVYGRRKPGKLPHRTPLSRSIRETIATHQQKEPAG